MVADPIDVAIRHQAYIENVKNYEEDKFDDTAEALAVLLALLLAKWGYEKISDMPKRKLREFIAEFNRRADKLLKDFVADFIKELKGVARADALVTMLNYSQMSGKPAKSPNVKQTWSKMTADPISGTGHMPLTLINDFWRAVKQRFGLLIFRAYAEGWSPARVMAELRGTKDRLFKNGLLHKLRNQFNTMQRTIIQHLHAWLLYNFGRMFYDHYQWISVLDSRTTDICRERHHNIYRYGDGPMPPAHFNCRSTIVGMPSYTPSPAPNAFYSWIKGQPASVQNDLLGATQARQLREGKLKSKSLPRLSGSKKIAPGDLPKYQPKMTKE